MRTPIVDQIFGHNKAPIADVLAADFAELVKGVDDALSGLAKLPAVIRDEAALGAYGQSVVSLRALAKQIDETRGDEGRPLLTAKRDLDAFFTGLVSRLDSARKGLESTATDYQRAVEAERRRKADEEAQKLREREEEARRKADEAATAAGAAKAEGDAERLASRAERAEATASASAADLTRTKIGGVTSSAKTVWTFRIEDYAALSATMGPLGPFIAREDVEKAIRSLVRIQKGATSLPGVTVFEDVQATFRK